MTASDLGHVQDLNRGEVAGRPLQWIPLARFAQYLPPLRIVDRTLVPGSRVLDWGCGNGHFSYFLARRGFQTVGYSFDPAPPILQSHPSFVHETGQTGDPVGIPFPAASFDAVLSVGVLEHVHEIGGDQRASIREIERVLKPGGLFLCFHLPNRYSWIEALVRLWAKPGGDRFFHDRTYTRAGFAGLLAGTELRIVAGWRYGCLPRNSTGRLPAWLSNTRPGVHVYNALDRVLGRMFPILCQNWCFVVRKEG